MRLAIIGVGPKGLYALERLLDHASPVGGAPLRVDLFEPDPHPGAGPNYSPSEPNFLIMNFAASLVDMWWPQSRNVPSSERHSFLDWSSQVGLPIEGDSYPPRALVGRYLSAGFETLLRYAPGSVDIRMRACHVERLTPKGTGWDVIVAGKSAGTYDEVLLATGHSQGSPYPVTQWLSRERVAPRATVAVRGFALTFIDVVLALTEGRGGSFSQLDHPYRLRYTAPNDPIGAVVPFSRTGRPMLAKPYRSVPGPTRELERIAEEGRSELYAIGGTADLSNEVLPVIARVATASLSAADGFDGEDSERWLSAAASGSPIAPTDSAYQEIERSLAVATGHARPGLSWALGHTWRSLYPAVVARLGGEGLADDDWPAFLRLSAELERVAFGPPAINAAKLLALVDAGQVDLSHLTSGVPQADVTVDAVIAGPGVSRSGNTVAARLIADGHARVGLHRRGLDVDADGSCRSADGHAVMGLAAIGRPTEDSVIGNDTLSRTLHPAADRWAQRVVARHVFTVAA